MKFVNINCEESDLIIFISDKLIATNCHVALAVQEGPRERFIEVKKNNKEEYALARLTKIDEGHDVLPIDGGGMVILGETHSQGDDDGDIWGFGGT